MSRKLRYVPEGGNLVEVTCRTLHSRFLRRPRPELNDLVVGVLTSYVQLAGQRRVGSTLTILHCTDDLLKGGHHGETARACSLVVGFTAPVHASQDRQRGEDFHRLRYATVETLHLSPLPCWQHLPEEEWRRRALGVRHLFGSRQPFHILVRAYRLRIEYSAFQSDF